MVDFLYGKCRSIPYVECLGTKKKPWDWKTRTGILPFWEGIFLVTFSEARRVVKLRGLGFGDTEEIRFFGIWEGWIVFLATFYFARQPFSKSKISGSGVSDIITTYLKCRKFTRSYKQNHKKKGHLQRLGAHVTVWSPMYFAGILEGQCWGGLPKGHGATGGVFANTRMGLLLCFFFFFLGGEKCKRNHFQRW